MKSLAEIRAENTRILKEIRNTNQEAFDEVENKLMEESITYEEGTKSSIQNLLKVAKTLYVASNSDSEKWEIIGHLRRTQILLDCYTEENLITYIHYANDTFVTPYPAKLGIAMIAVGLSMIIAPIIAASIVGLSLTTPFLPLLIIGLVFGIAGGLASTTIGSCNVYVSIKETSSDKSSLYHAMHKFAEMTDEGLYKRTPGLVASQLSFFDSNKKMIEKEACSPLKPGGYNLT